MTEQPAFAHAPWVYVFVDDAGADSPGHVRIREGDGTAGAVVLVVRGEAVLFVETHRRPLGRRLTELPRGFADPGETPPETAVRELREETGITVQADDLTPLGPVAPNSGILESLVETFLVRLDPVDEIRVEAEPGETGTVRWVPVAEAMAMAGDGRIIDGFTLAALFRATLRGLLPSTEGIS